LEVLSNCAEGEQIRGGLMTSLCLSLSAACLLVLFFVFTCIMYIDFRHPWLVPSTLFLCFWTLSRGTKTWYWPSLIFFLKKQKRNSHRQSPHVSIVLSNTLGASVTLAFFFDIVYLSKRIFYRIRSHFPIVSSFSLRPTALITSLCDHF
jgi:hypothetical protein